MTKLFAIDLDGILLNTQHAMPEQFRHAIREALLQGYHATLMTGQSSRSALLYARFLGLTSPLICLDGAAVVAPGSGELLYASPLAEKSSKRLLRMAEAMQIPYLLDGEHYLITNNETDLTRSWQLRSMVRPRGFPQAPMGQWMHFPLFIQNVDALSEPVFKVSLECGTKSSQEEVLAQVKGLTDLCVKRADPWRLHFTNQGSHKLQALQFLAELHKISLDDIVTLENADNELERLTGVGFSV